MPDMPKVQPGQVPPGNETGLYYIIVANLPWQCSWQRLKDFARSQQPDGSCLNVDHATVYPGTTNGWVRVKGKQDFHKALARLDGGVFEHRALMADGRNETSWVHLPDISSSRTAPSSRSRHGSAASTSTGYLQQPNSSFDHPNQENYLPTPSFPPVATTFQSFPTVHESAQYAVQQPTQYMPPVSAAGSVTYAGRMAPETPVYIPAPVYNYVVPMQYGKTMAVPQVSEPPQTIKTEARKIIITQLPHSTTLGELSELLAKCVTKLMAKGKISSTSPQSIQELDIACHSDGKPKGHAFAVFESHHTAKCVVNALDKYKFQGRSLNARLAKEGVEAPRRWSKTANEARSMGSADRRSSGRTSSSKKDERRPAPLEPGVAAMANLDIQDVQPSNGSLNRYPKGKDSSSRRRTKPDETSKMSRGAWNGAPAVVDGSSSSRVVSDGGHGRNYRS